MAILIEYILPIVLTMAVGIGSIQWCCWIFKVGRFSKQPSVKTEKENSPLRYMVANFFVNIINDFRHLLALFIASIFAFTLFYSLYKTSWSDTEKIINVMQSVSSTFGGLIGAIIGFYFGEKTGKASNKSSHDFERTSEILEQDEVISQGANDFEEVTIPDENTVMVEDKS